MRVAEDSAVAMALFFSGMDDELWGVDLAAADIGNAVVHTSLEQVHVAEKFEEGQV